MKKLIVLALLAVATSANAADRATVERGQKNFREFGCWKCHGTVGQGSGSGLKLAPDVLPTDAIITFLRTTTGPMPRYGEQVISDEQIKDIHAYLEAQPRPQSPDNIPALRNLRSAK